MLALKLPFNVFSSDDESSSDESPTTFSFMKSSLSRLSYKASLHKCLMTKGM
uniref:Uncharacterized protein n=1 Tax=Arundo donax TaxID=35708 RepID=A0A0A8ZKK5_ARUDO